MRRIRRRRWRRSVSLVPGLSGQTVRWLRERERERWVIRSDKIKQRNLHFYFSDTERKWEKGLHKRVN